MVVEGPDPFSGRVGIFHKVKFFVYESTQKAILTARKQGIEVFGAVVDDYESIKKLYGEKYCFDCRSYAELEKRSIMCFFHLSHLDIKVKK